MKENKRGFAFGTLLTIGLITGMLVAMQVVPNALNIPGWNTVAEAADGDPGAGASGLLEIFIYPRSADPYTDYATNLSSASAYASRNTFNGACTGNVPYDTAFDIVVKARYNTTHAYNSTGSNWEMDWVRSLVTCANLGVAGDTEVNKVQIGSNATYLWVNFYLQAAAGGNGTGFTITHGQVVNVTSWKLQAYF